MSDAGLKPTIMWLIYIRLYSVKYYIFRIILFLTRSVKGDGVSMLMFEFFHCAH